MSLKASFTDGIEKIDWYHPKITRHIAECMLMQNSTEGSYLMRPRSKGDGYAISVRGLDAVRNYEVNWEGEQLKFAMITFSSFADFIHHFQQQPLLSGDSGLLIQLKQPYSRSIDEPHMYDVVQVHAEMGATGNASSPHPAVGSKEGYLTKLGGRFKTWKTRWCVLVQNHMSYYKDQDETEPIRTLDLTDCKDCLRDINQGKENCFRLELSWRTFYMYASTEREMYEWIDLIRWKMDFIKKQKQKEKSLYYIESTK